MRLHANAALSFRQRERMVRRVVEQGWSIKAAAEAAEVSDRTCSKWVARYRAEGLVGLADRSSAPLCIANRTDQRTVEVIAALRRLRFTGPEIAELLDRRGMATGASRAALCIMDQQDAETAAVYVAAERALARERALCSEAAAEPVSTSESTFAARLIWTPAWSNRAQRCGRSNRDIRISGWIARLES